MAMVRERVYIEAPYTQALPALERRLGLAPGEGRGECVLTLTLPVTEGRELARTVTAATERLAASANYTARFALRWDAGLSSRGIPTPGFTGTLSVSAGEDYDETALELDGGYEPPGGLAGRAFDELIGRPIAHATLTALLGGVGDELRAEHARIEAGKHGG